MASFTQDTLNSTKARDPNEEAKMLSDLQRAQQAAQRRQGMALTKTDEFEQAPIFDKYRKAEQERRIAAAPGAAQVGGQIDERIAGTANQLNSVYDKYNNTRADLMQRQGQSTLTTDFEKEQGLWGVGQKRKELDFGLYKNQAQRDDAINNLWTQGIAEDKLLDMGINHQLKLQDITKYFALEQNKIQQDFLDWQSKTQADWDAMIRKMESDASAWGSIFSGILGTVGTVVGGMYGGPTGALLGGTTGSKLGAGFGGML
jgi:hypothetical protein